MQEVSKVTVKNGIKWAAVYLNMGAYLTRRDALQLPKELSLAVEEGRWKLLEVFNVSLPSDMLLLT